MIISRPKTSTVFSLLVFLLLSYGLSFYLIFSIAGGQSATWIFVLLGIVLGIALGVTYKVLTGYKKVFLGKKSVSVHYLFGLLKKDYTFKELAYWKEEVIKTASGTFKELHIQFHRRKRVRLSMQEHDNYERVKSFMQKNYARKQQKEG